MTGAKTKTELQNALVRVFRQGIEVVSVISDEIFAGEDPSTSIGAHFRHNHEFAVGLLDGLGSGAIDYAARRRDPVFAGDRVYALSEMERMATRIAGATFDLGAAVRVRSEVDREVEVISTVGRELEFLLSHTVHHFALIGFKLNSVGIELPSDFGVAPSTLAFRTKGERCE